MFFPIFSTLSFSKRQYDKPASIQNSKAGNVGSFKPQCNYHPYTEVRSIRDESSELDKSLVHHTITKERQYRFVCELVDFNL